MRLFAALGSALLAAAHAPRAADAFGPNSLVVLSVVDQTSTTSPVTLTEFDYTNGNVVDSCASPHTRRRRARGSARRTYSRRPPRPRAGVKACSSPAPAHPPAARRPLSSQMPCPTRT